MASSSSGPRPGRPLGRLSFAPASPLPARHSASGHLSSAFQAPTLSAGTPASSPAKQQFAPRTMQPFAGFPASADFAAAAHDQAAPNANVSGLPVPSSKQQIPSTVSSALRRRPATNLLRPPSSTGLLAGSGLQQFAAGGPAPIRRSQSQRPAGEQPFANSKPSRQNLTTSCLAARLRGNSTNQLAGARDTIDRASAGNGNNQNNDDDDEEDEEDSLKGVESLPPLRSTSYLNRLISEAPGERKPARRPDREPSLEHENRSEPVCGSGLRAPAGSALAKPSQLVKPIMSARAVSGTGSGSAQSQGGAGKQRPALSRLPELKKPDRRLSLQHVGYNSLSLSLEPAASRANGQLRLEKENSLEESGDESDFDEDDDDDATTATTMTQMSDSNLASANQELNSMIQMLSSSAILGESNCSVADSVSSTSYENTEPFARRAPLGRRIPTLAASGRPAAAEPGAGQLPRVKRKVVKSQSTNFASAPKKEPNSSRTGALKESYCNYGASREQVSQVQKNNSFQQAQAPPAGVKLPRPRSRIIFDPTSSQFHVSCTTEAQQQSSDDSSESDYDDDDDDEDEDDDGDQNHAGEVQSVVNPKRDDYVRRLVGGSTRRVENNEPNESSLKLLDTHNQIVTLKYLPTIGNSSRPRDESAPAGEPPKNKQDLEQENETIRKLKDCRGSLESLCLIRQGGLSANLATSASSANETPPPPYGSLQNNQFSLLPGGPAAAAQLPVEAKQRTRSPVGSAIRSLFGRPQSSQAAKGGSSNIVRHGSLRLDSRKFSPEVPAAPLARQASLRGERPEEPAIPAAPAGLGGDLLHRAGRKLSASSSSLTSKFKFISSSSSCASKQPDGSSKTNFNPPTKQDNLQKNDGLPPRMPTSNEHSSKYQTMSNGHSVSVNSLTNGSNKCDEKTYLPSEQSIKSLCDETDYGASNGFDNDGDTTILSDTSTLHGDSSYVVHVNKCAELERTVESLKNKLIAKEKEMTELQLKQWSDDYLIGQLKTNIVRLEKENAQLKNVVHKLNKSTLA